MTAGVMSGDSVAALLARLAVCGAVLTAGEGDALALSGKRPPADLLEEVKVRKPDVLAYLKGETVAASLPSPSSVTETKSLHSEVSESETAHRLTAKEVKTGAPVDALPEHLALIVEEARLGNLPTGAQALTSGLVMNLGGYVLAWAECWPRDKAHVLARLEEAYAVCPAFHVPDRATKTRGAA